jgi:hypothetical protein
VVPLHNGHPLHQFLLLLSEPHTRGIATTAAVLPTALRCCWRPLLVAAAAAAGRACPRPAASGCWGWRSSRRLEDAAGACSCDAAAGACRCWRQRSCC